MTTAPSTTPQVIQAYADNGFTVSGVRHEGAIVVLRTRTVAWAAPQDIAALTVEDFAPVLAAGAEADIILLGCGKRAALMRAELRAQLRDAGVAVEVMDSGAACRTFNLLQMEGRRVAALLMPLA